jgi:hypothetical protein
MTVTGQGISFNKKATEGACSDPSSRQPALVVTMDTEGP